MQAGVDGLLRDKTRPSRTDDRAVLTFLGRCGNRYQTCPSLLDLLRQWSNRCFSGVTSIMSALASIHSCSVIVLSAITYLPSVCSSCQVSRHYLDGGF
jgi:hypothetical protein